MMATNSAVLCLEDTAKQYEQFQGPHPEIARLQRISEAWDRMADAALTGGPEYVAAKARFDAAGAQL